MPKYQVLVALFLIFILCIVLVFSLHRLRSNFCVSRNSPKDAYVQSIQEINVKPLFYVFCDQTPRTNANAKLPIKIIDKIDFFETTFEYPRVRDSL